MASARWEVMWEVMGEVMGVPLVPLQVTAFDLTELRPVCWSRRWPAG